MGEKPCSNMMLGPKLVVLAALLSAVAFAAPRTVFVETEGAAVEETLVQSSAKTATAVAMLKNQFKALEVQLKSGAKVTPAVAKVINEMIQMVTDDIEPAIKEAHAADQEELDAKMLIITDFNADQTTTRDLLLKTGADIETSINEHNAVALDWDDADKAYLAAIKHYEETTKSKTDTCCDKQQAAVVATEYTPSSAECDYTTATDGSCLATAQGAVADAVNAAFTSGLSRYNDLNAGCDSMTSDLAAAKSDMDAKNTKCDNHEADARARKKLLDTQIENFDADWANAVKAYDAGIAEAEGNFTTSRTRVQHDEADRKEEWASTQEIKCMLQAYQAGGKFDEAQMSICKGQIDTEHLVINCVPIPPRVVWTKPIFTELTDWSSYATDCHEEEQADESADQHCTIVGTPAAPVCDPETPAPGSDGNGGPRWELSDAGKEFAQ